MLFCLHTQPWAAVLHGSILQWLRKKGLASADKKSGRLAAEGAIVQYIHPGSRLGVLLEVNCETDFVAAGDVFNQLANTVAMQVRVWNIGLGSSVSLVQMEPSVVVLCWVRACLSRQVVSAESIDSGTWS